MPDPVAPGNGQGTAAPAEGAAPAVQGTAAAVATPPAAPAPVAVPWLEGADPAVVGYVQNKGWEQPVQMLESYQNLEKLLGAERAGNTVILPKPDAPKQEVDTFYNRLGRPADPTGYKLEVPALNGDPEFAKAAAGKMHELGLSKAQGEGLGQWFNEHFGSVLKTAEADVLARNQEQQAALKTAWGSAFDQNKEIAAAAARGLGVDAATLDALDQALGFDKTMQLFHSIGTKIREPEFVDGSGNRTFGAALTPGQAQAKIAELKVDKNWVSRLMNHDAAATAEWKQLHEYAYPEQANG